jgi:hypothetical protein
VDTQKLHQARIVDTGREASEGPTVSTLVVIGVTLFWTLGIPILRGVFVVIRAVIVFLAIKFFRVLEKLWHMFRTLLSKCTGGWIKPGFQGEEKIDIKVRGRNIVNIE